MSSDLLDGKVGRIYMPKQKVDTMALVKPKGTKRERREEAADRKAKRKAGNGGSGDGRGTPAAAAGGDDA